MAYALHDELQSAQPLKFQPLFCVFYIRPIQISDFHTRVEKNMLFMYIVVCGKIGGCVGITRGEIK